MKKRILSLALALCMMLSVMPTSYAGNGVLTLGDSDVQQENTAVDTPVENAGPSLTLDGIGDSENEPKEQPVEEEPVYGVLTPDGFETENREEDPNEPIYGVLTPDEPIEDETDNQSDWEDNEPAPGVLYFQCDFCGYLDGNHSDHCPTLKTEDESEDDSEEEPEAVDISTIKATLMSAKTYQDIFDALMSAETLDEFESILDELAEDKLEEFYDLLSDDDLDALDAQEDNLASEAVVSFEKKEVTKKTVTVERRASLFGAAQRELLRQLGYELIVNMFGWIVDAIDLPQNDYTVMEAISPETAADYQWQILADDDLWVDIYNETASTIRVSYAMVANLLDRYDTVQVRCEITGEDGVTYTDPVEVCVDYTSDDVIIDAEEEPIVDEEPIVEEEPVVEEPVAQMFSVSRLSGSYDQNYSISLLSDTTTESDSIPANESPDTETPSTYSIIINYLYTDSTQAAAPWSAIVGAGTPFNETVISPSVMGYAPRKTEVELDYDAVNNNIVIDVYYDPAEVEFKVIHLQQNLLNDGYEEFERETLPGVTEDSVGDGLQNDYTGFYALLYDTTTAIAADGSTEVIIYYDRIYYLMSFDLGDGGYGTEPIYARYGVELGDIATPVRPGYTFKGWTLDGTSIVTLPRTMPANNVTYKAVWEEENTAKVTVVFWGETANCTDEAKEYDYYGSGTLNAEVGKDYTYGSESLACATEAHTHTEECIDCGQEEHSHTLENNCYTLNCDQASHNHTTAGCMTNCSHHTLGCYDTTTLRYLKETTPGQTISTNGDGIYTYTSGGTTHYYLYLDGKWYCAYGSITGSKYDGERITLTCTHTHSEDCYTCGEGTHIHSVDGGCYDLTCTKEAHTHNANCNSCGKAEHTHTNDCVINVSETFPNNLWTKVESETKKVLPDGSTVVNVYYDRTEFTLTFKGSSNYGGTNTTYGTITDKWGADIEDRFFNICETAYESSGTYSWSQNTNGGSPWTSYVGVMPQENRTYYAYDRDGTMTAYYYFETLDGQYNDEAGNVKTVTAEGSGFTVTKEDRAEFEGFTHDESISTQNGSSFNGAKFYYTRNSYTLDFNNGVDVVSTNTVKYQAPLDTYDDYIPTAPSIYEPNSVKFDGWYQNRECTGEKYVLAEHTMPAENMILYAKWVSVTCKVEFYLNQAEYEKGNKLSTHPDVTVEHGDKINPTPKDPSNGNYTFVGWFYIDEHGEEKAFDVKNMPVKHDLKLFGKWSSNKLMEYTIHYQLEDGTTIAESTTGSALAGNAKTFYAKTGNELNTGYQSGYYPLTSSHSLTLDIEKPENNVYVFVYQPKDKVSYVVRYLESGTNKVLIEEKTVETSDAIITETFVPYSGYMPDAYQKRLVLSSNESENVITFYYTKDDVHAPVLRTHYIQNIEGDGYSEYQSTTDLNGTIGQEYEIAALTLNGFSLNLDVEGSLQKGALTSTGLHLKLYYDRVEYPYEFRFLENNTSNELAKTEKGDARYQAKVSETAKEIPGYRCISSSVQSMVIQVENDSIAVNNVKTFWYEELSVQLQYQVVGSEGCGMLSSYSETIAAKSGNANGSVASANTGYTFAGWYSDEACTAFITKDQSFKPSRNSDGIYETAVYYAKFVENTVTINYKGVAPDGTVFVDSADCGAVRHDAETLAIYTGIAVGSTAYVSNDTYRFIGWYDKAECSGDPISSNATFVPTKDAYAAWVDGTTYFAKFEYNVADLTITKAGWNALDSYQTFIFTLTGTSENTRGTEVTVYVSQDGSVTIGNLPVGEYTLTEQTSWSWRYDPKTGEQGQPVMVIGGQTNEVVFDNDRVNNKWLDGNSWCQNTYGEKAVFAPVKKKDDDETN